MLDVDPDLDFAGFEPNDFRKTSLRPGDRGECRRCLKPDYQVLSTEEIVESVLDGDQPGESISIDSEWRWWCYEKCLKCEIVMTLSYNMLMRQMTVTFKVFVNTFAHQVN